MKRMLIIGEYMEEYPRNRTLIRALGEVFDSEVINVSKRKSPAFAFAKELFSRGKGKDYVFVVQPPARFVFTLFIFRIFHRTQIIADMFYSIYDSYIFDRKLARAWSLKAFYYFLLDFFMCRVAHMLVFDTKEHQRYFESTFKLHKGVKSLILPVSIDLTLANSISGVAQKSPLFEVLFYGAYIPLQGVEYIVKACDVLREQKGIHFTLLGSGQTKANVMELVKNLNLQNITFRPWVTYTELLQTIKSSDVSLGIFGDTGKASRVIPNKVLEAMACKTIVITGKNDDLAEHFKDGEEIFFVPMSDPKTLAGAIVRLEKMHRERPEELERIKLNAYRKIENNFSLENLIKTIKQNIIL
jgi:glycosyltransferase involved in cell wall biosynthesis